MTNDILPMIIAMVLSFVLGACFGALWGLSRYKDIYGWLSASLFSRMVDAMRSLQYEQEDIDRVMSRMGQRIMPPSTPPPPAPKAKERQESVEFAAEVTVPASHGPLLSELTDKWKDKIIHCLRFNDLEGLVSIADRIRLLWAVGAHIDQQRLQPGVKIYYADYEATGKVIVIYTLAPAGGDDMNDFNDKTTTAI